MLTAFVAGEIMSVYPQTYKIMIIIWMCSGITAYLILASADVYSKNNSFHTELKTKILLKDILISPFVRTFRLFKDDRDFWAFEWRFFLYGAAFLVIEPLLVVYFVDTFNFSFSDVGRSMGLIMGGIFIVLLPIMAKLFIKLTPFTSAAIVCCILSFFPLTIYLTPTENPAESKFLIYIAIAIFGFGMCGIHLLWNLVAIFFADSRKRDSAPYMGAHLLLVAIRGMILPNLGAQLIKIKSIGMRGVFLISSITFFIATLLFIQYQLLLNYRAKKQAKIFTSPEHKNKVEGKDE